MIAFDPFSPEIGHQIRQLRRSKQLSQEEFAEMAGVSQQTVSAVENGLIRPCLRIFQAISELNQDEVHIVFRTRLPQARETTIA